MVPLCVIWIKGLFFAQLCSHHECGRDFREFFPQGMGEESRDFGSKGRQQTEVRVRGLREEVRALFILLGSLEMRD
jgi:hypothetical protein